MKVISVPAVHLVMGSPASGKSTLTKNIAHDNAAIILNRDTEGGKVTSLIPKMIEALQRRQSVVLDNTFPTVESRKPFIESIKKEGFQIYCHFMTTSAEDCLINALHRMWERYGQIYFHANDMKGIKDPNIFPPAPIFKYKKELEKPSIDEGFTSVTDYKFKRRPLDYSYKNKAILLDIDGTLRETIGGQYKYPTTLEEQKCLIDRGKKIREYVEKGYKIFAVSNQSGVAKGHLSEAMAIHLIEAVALQLDIKFDEVLICPHKIPPAACYCRKPQSGMGVYLIEKYKLNPGNVIMIGDMTTDNTFARRLGFVYRDHNEFFNI